MTAFLSSLFSFGWLFDILTAPIILLMLGGFAIVVWIGRLLRVIPAGYSVAAGILANIAVLWIAFSVGYRLADDRAAMEALRAANEALQRDLNIQREATTIVAEAQQRLEQENRSNEQMLQAFREELEATLADKDDSCKLDRARIERLRKLQR